MDLQAIALKVQEGRSKDVKEFVQSAIDEGASSDAILGSLLSGMNVIGEKFKAGEVFVPQVLVAARAMNMGMAVLKPLLVQEGVSSRGKLCIGTVRGDLHDIGKNLVKMMIEGKNIEVIDLGIDAEPQKFVDAVKDQGCSVICMSALLTTTMGVMKEVIDALTAAGLRDKVKVMIGGAPVTKEFADSIGADVYTENAADAADEADKLYA